MACFIAVFWVLLFITETAGHFTRSFGNVLGNHFESADWNVGEVPNFIGQTFGSVPSVFENVGQLNLEELRKLAKNIGDAWQGAGFVTNERIKRFAEHVVNSNGLKFNNLVTAAQRSFQQAINGTTQEFCKLIYFLESSISNAQTSSIASGPMFDLFHKLLNNSKETFCSGVDIKDEVDKLVNTVRQRS